MPRSRRRFNARRETQLERIIHAASNLWLDLPFSQKRSSQAGRLLTSEVYTIEDASSDSSSSTSSALVLRSDSMIDESSSEWENEFPQAVGSDDDSDDDEIVDDSDDADSDARGIRLKHEDDEFFSDEGDLSDDPFQRELRGSMPEPRLSLQVAAMRGHLKELQRWKNWRISLNGGKAQGDTPLHCAARAGDVGTVEELLEQGASISAKNLFDHSPLEIAARYGHTAVVKTLLERGAGEDPAEMVRAYEATRSWAVVKALTLYDDACHNDVNSKKVYAPWINQMLFKIVQQGRFNILKDLLDMGAYVNCKGILGCSPLQLAVCLGHVRCVSALLEGGADVNSRDMIERTPLHYAVREGHHDIAVLLLEAGADMSAKSRLGRTPLEVARDEAIRQLLENYKDSEIRD